MTQEIKGLVVDRGGIRGKDGRLVNQGFVRPGGDGITFTTIPHACNETSIEAAPNYLEKLRRSPDSVD
jgi:hypothetical protein